MCWPCFGLYVDPALGCVGPNLDCELALSWVVLASPWIVCWPHPVCVDLTQFVCWHSPVCVGPVLDCGGPALCVGLVQFVLDPALDCVLAPPSLCVGPAQLVLVPPSLCWPSIWHLTEIYHEQ